MWKKVAVVGLIFAPAAISLSASSVLSIWLIGFIALVWCCAIVAIVRALYRSKRARTEPLLPKTIVNSGLVTPAAAATAILAFSFAMQPIAQASAFTYEASRFTFAAVVFGWLIFAVGRGVYLSNGRGRFKPITSTKAYSVPRRFGLGTLLIVTLAFGAIAAALRSLEIHPVAILCTLLLVGLVGALQFLMDRVPRQASMVAGSLFTTVAVTTISFLHPPPTSTAPCDLAFYLACYAVAGGLLGYCIGTLVGAHFMLMERAGFLFTKNRNSELITRGLRPSTARAISEHRRD